MPSKRNETTKAETILVPHGRTGKQSFTVRERMKCPRLQGADVYVARFGGWKRLSKQSHFCDNTNPDPMPLSGSGTDVHSTSERDHPPSIIPTSSGSLRDELINPHPRTDKTKRSAPSNHFDWNTVHMSRPCYRCVSYMHSAGIKRAFWTTDNGKWEGAKVRDLVAALDMAGTSSGVEGGHQFSNGDVFITKHEVLLMRRRMGEN
jgi:hypothetical protein